MKTCIVLLRGINVGGHRKIPMAELRELLIAIGFDNIKTYIQSGNIVFQSNETLKNIRIQVEKGILNHFGFEVLAQIKTHKELNYIYNNCPFTKGEKEKSYFMMLDAFPHKSDLENVEEIKHKGEKVVIKDNCIYLFSENGYGRTKFSSNFYEKKLKVNATARNYNTIIKLLSMAEELESKL